MIKIHKKRHQRHSRNAGHACFRDRRTCTALVLGGCTPDPNPADVAEAFMEARWYGGHGDDDYPDALDSALGGVGDP